MSRRAVAISKESASVLNEGSIESLESGGLKEVEGVKGVFGVSVAAGSMKDDKAKDTDFVRWNVGAR